jgi:hypothetical protein
VLDAHALTSITKTTAKAGVVSLLTMDCSSSELP